MNKTECAWQAWKSHETVIDSSQHTSTITCADASRVWHFSAFHSAGNNISESKLYDQDQRTDIGTKFTTRTNVLKLGLELETNNRFETFFKDNGGNSGRAVKFTRLKNKTLKALTIRRDILPKEVLTRIDKCKLKHGNLELITVVHTVIYTIALSLWGGGGGGVYMYMFRAIWEFAQSRDCVAHSQNPKIAHCTCAIPRLRNTHARSRDCATIARNLSPQRTHVQKPSCGYERSY